MRPRPLTQIRVVEITSRCNLACAYCLHPIMPRPKIDMTDAIWARTLAWIRHFVAQGTQGEVNLSGVGEPTLHPHLARYCAELRDVLGPQGVIQFTTNGKTKDLDLLIRALKPSRPSVCVTAHHFHLAQPAAWAYHAAGLLRAVSCDPVLAPQDWAGQVECPTPNVTPTRHVCDLLAGGLGSINADGTFVMCCMDGTGETSRGTVFDDPMTTTITMQDWRLCASCWQRPPED